VKLTLVLGNLAGRLQNELQRGLKEVGGLVDFRLHQSGDDVILDISGNKDIDFNGIFKLLLDTNLRIKSLEATEPSLEEAFLSLIGSGEP
jgi:hypothetical protein